MKHLLLIISLFITSNLCSQIKIEYNLYLIIDSEKNNSVFLKNDINTVYSAKFFTIIKKIPEEAQKYSFAINRKGKLIPLIKGSIGHKKDGVLFLSHFSIKNQKKKVLKIADENFLNLEQILNTKFSEILNLLQEASNLFVIDLAEEDVTSNFYTAYQVQF